MFFNIDNQIIMLTNENDRLEIINKINDCKDQIKNSSQKILASADIPKSENIIGSEVLEILTALGKIGTLTGNSKTIFAYTKALGECFATLALNDNPRIPLKHGYQVILNQLCGTSFDVIQKGKKFEIKIPKVDFTFLKLGFVNT
jgi:hypothetical protein